MFIKKKKVALKALFSSVYCLRIITRISKQCYYENKNYLKSN